MWALLTCGRIAILEAIQLPDALYFRCCNSGCIRSPIRLNLTAIAPIPLSASDKLGHYEVVFLLGQGGMGEVLAVYSAEQSEREMRGGIYLTPQEAI